MINEEKMYISQYFQGSHRGVLILIGVLGVTIPSQLNFEQGRYR